MLSDKPLLSRIIPGIVYVIVVILGIFLFFAPPSLFPDPANGFHVMRSMQMGAGFNQLTSPDQSDITQNASEFLTWWSPGQYLAPYAFKLLFGLNTGQATAIVITICQLLGLTGLLAFFRKIGFSATVSALSILFIACQQFFIIPYVFYNGGEILFFGFAGWFLYGCTVINRRGWALAVFVLLSGWVGFFCKSSMLWMYGAGMLFLWLRLSMRRSTLDLLLNAAWIAVPAIISLAGIWIFFLSKGQNPASAVAPFKFTWKAFGFPLASPLLSGFSIDDLVHGLIYHTGKPLFTGTNAVVVMLILAVLSVWLVRTILQKVGNRTYRLLIRVFYIVTFIFFGYAYLRQMAISYEARHFRIIGLMVIPGTLFLISRMKPAYRLGFGLIWIFITATSIVYLVKGYHYNKTQSAHGVSGLAQQGIDQKSLDRVMSLDRQNKHAIFVFVDESLGLEIEHNRVVTLEPIDNSLKIDYDDYEHDGHDGPMYIILPESYAGPKEKMILKSFPDYHGWNASMLSDKYVMYEAK